MMRRYAGIQVRNGKIMSIWDEVAVEETYLLYLNGSLLTRLVASPDRLRELGAGFVICEGLAPEVESVHVTAANEIFVEASSVRAVTGWELRSCGAYGLADEPEPVTAALSPTSKRCEALSYLRYGRSVTPQEVMAVRDGIESDTWMKTGGVHSAVLFTHGKPVVSVCDVGRHNTIDKVVGYAGLNGIDRSSSIIGCSGRQPGAMVKKVANAGIPVIVSRASSTDQGIAAAEKAGVTLICFAREGRFTIYTHPGRVAGVPESI